MAQSSKALLVALFFFCSVFSVDLSSAAKGEDSASQVITYTDTNEGDITFTYSTYLDGEVGYQIPYLKGKIEIKDKNYQDRTGNWVPSVWKQQPAPSTKAESKTVRVAMEFGVPGREMEYREQVRFMLYVMDGTDRKFEDIENIKDFNGSALGDAAQIESFHKKVYVFIVMEENNKALDKRKLAGYTITSQAFDADKRTLMIEFTRPFDVSYDHSFFLQPTQEYILHIMWGEWDALNDDQGGQPAKAKGMKADLGAGGYNKGKQWTIPKPPGWDALGSVKKLKEQFGDDSKAGGSVNGIQTVSIYMLSALALLTASFIWQ